MIRDICVIGAGASGIFASILLSKKGYNVILIEKEKKIGKKISITGNGKCNLANFNIDEVSYRSNLEYAKNILKDFDANSLVRQLKEWGIGTYIKGDLLYPITDSAKFLVEYFEKLLVENKVVLKLNENIVDIEKEEDVFLVKSETYTYKAKKVIISTGGIAGNVKDYNGYSLAEKFGHTITPLYPALTKLKSNDIFMLKFPNIRIKSNVKLLVDNECIYDENGEIQFLKNIISGIVIMQLSRYAICAINDNKKVKLLVDLLPNLSNDDILEIVYNAKKQGKLGMEVFYGILREDIVKILYDTEEKMIQKLKKFEININDYLGFEHAQVTMGGIVLDEVSNKNMESKFCKDLYFTGEILNIDGNCGGYNLLFAFSTASKVANNIND